MFRKYSMRALRTTAVAALAAGWIGVHSVGSTAVAATLSQQQITQFLANPAAALAQYPAGGPELISLIRDLVLTDPATLNAILGLIPTALPAQQTAIGTGLGQAAVTLVRTNPTLANQIQQQLTACGSGLPPQPGQRSPCENAVLAFAGVTGNTAITAAGGGGGGGGGGAGSGPVVNGPPTGGTNSSVLPGTAAFPTGSFTIGGGTVTGGGTTTTITSTSPF